MTSSAAFMIGGEVILRTYLSALMIGFIVVVAVIAFAIVIKARKKR